MTGKNLFVLKLEEPGQDDQHLELSVFVKKTRQFLDLLKAGAKEVGQMDAAFPIVNLSRSSPIQVGCEPCDSDLSYSPAIFDGIANDLNLVEQGKVNEVSAQVFFALEKLVNYNGKQIERGEIQIVSPSNEILQTHDFARMGEFLSAARRMEEKCISTVDGKLEKIDIHSKTDVFKIYPTLPDAPAVRCEFPPERLDNVKQALGEYVSVQGECSYMPDSPFPHKISVRKIEILPQDGLPKLDDLRGIAPNGTGGLSAEEFVRRQRDEWD